MQYDVIVRKDPETGLLEADPTPLYVDRDTNGNDSYIVFTLDPQTLPNAKFSKSSKPLTWEKDPPWHIIKREIEIENAGRSLRVTDRHIGSGTADPSGYKYLLKVVEGSPNGAKSLSTGFSSPKSITSPIIINR